MSHSSSIAGKGKAIARAWFGETSTDSHGDPLIEGRVLASQRGAFDQSAVRFPFFNHPSEIGFDRLARHKSLRVGYRFTLMAGCLSFRKSAQHGIPIEEFIDLGSHCSSTALHPINKQNIPQRFHHE